MSSAATYQDKYKWLRYSALPILLLTYWLAIAPTVSLLGENKKLKQRVQLAQSAQGKVAATKAELLSINQRLGASDQSAADAAKANDQPGDQNAKKGNQQASNQALLSKVAAFCESEKLRFSFPEERLHKQGGFQLTTNEVEVTGPFSKTLLLIHELETSSRYGRLSSASFEMIQNRRTRKSELVTTIYVQNIKATE